MLGRPWWQILLMIWLFLFGLGYFVPPDLVQPEVLRRIVMGGLPICSALAWVFGK